MTTLVGLQTEFSAALRELCELDYDATQAYQAAIERLENSLYKQKLSEFRDDHFRHIKEITALLKEHRIPISPEPSVKGLLAKGKVVLAGLVGDRLILTAMKTNEDDTNTAYERLNNHAGKWADAAQILERGLADEKRHRAWIEDIIS